MAFTQITRREMHRLLLSSSRSLAGDVSCTRGLATLPHASVCRHAPGSCILCKQTVSGQTRLRFSSTESSKPSEDQQRPSSSESTGKKESDSAGTEGGMMGERSGPSKEAVPSDKQAVEDSVEEEHVKDKKQPETAPWAS